MVEIKVAKTSGFCWGVKRAIDISLETARGKSEPTYTLGPLIHNPQLITLLESNKIHAIDDIGRIEGGQIIIRTHGITPQKRKEIKSKGFSIKDATCPLVARVQGLIKKYSKKGYPIVIIGDENHAEVKGLKGFAETPVHVIESSMGVAGLPEYEKVFVAAQTTCDVVTYAEAVGKLKNKYNSVEVGDTVCDATSDRQSEAIKLAAEVDVMVVVGGRNSANTARLASIAKKCGTKTFHVETDEDLNLFQLSGSKTIGVTAGASTPNWMIDRVVEKLKTLSRPQSFLYLYDSLRFIVKSNIYIAFAGTVFAISNMKLMGMEKIAPISVIVFCAILSTYLLNQLLRNPETLKMSKSRRYRYHLKHRVLFWSMGLMSAGIGFIISMTYGVMVPLLFFCVVFFGSTYHFNLWRGKRILRITQLMDIPASKDFFVALAWVIVTVVIPYLAAEAATGYVIPLIFTLGVAYIRTVLYDIRDIGGDQIIGKEAISVIVGKEKTTYSLYAVMVFLSIFLISAFLAGKAEISIIGMLVGLAYLLWFSFYGIKKEWRFSTKFELFLDTHFFIVGFLVYFLIAISS